MLHSALEKKLFKGNGILLGIGVLLTAAVCVPTVMVLKKKKLNSLGKNVWGYGGRGRVNRPRGYA